MYAVVTSANIGAAETDRMRILREEIVPRVQQAPGFVRGYWVFDEQTSKGHSMVFFETEEQARAQLALLKERMPDGPAPGIAWELRTCGEVVAQAER